MCVWVCVCARARVWKNTCLLCMYNYASVTAYASQTITICLMTCTKKFTLFSLIPDNVAADDYRLTACMNILKRVIQQGAQGDIDDEATVCTNPDCTRSRPNSTAGNKCVCVQPSPQSPDAQADPGRGGDGKTLGKPSAESLTEGKSAEDQSEGKFGFLFVFYSVFIHCDIFCWLIDWLIDWFDWLIDWLIDWSVLCLRVFFFKVWMNVICFCLVVCAHLTGWLSCTA